MRDHAINILAGTPCPSTSALAVQVTVNSSFGEMVTDEGETSTVRIGSVKTIVMEYITIEMQLNHCIPGMRVTGPTSGLGR